MKTRIFALLLTLVMAFALTGCSSAVTVEDPEHIIEKTDLTPAPENTTESNTSVDFKAIFGNDQLSENFLLVCTQIGINPTDISDFEQVDDWSGGSRYTCSYGSLPLRIYCSTDNTIETIYIGPEVDVFSKTEGAYHIENYKSDLNIISQVEAQAQEIVKSQLNYPSTSSFPWLDWRTGRDHDIYTVSSKVTAQNAFGVESELPFTMHFEVDAASKQVHLRYFMLDGTVIVNELSQVAVPERMPAVKQTSSLEETTHDDILITAGELGDYGQTITDTDGEVFIDYHVPAGTYQVTSKVPMCVVYVEDNTYFVNDDGYKECKNISETQFSAVDEQHEITVGENEHIFVTINAKLLLEKIS